MTSRTTTTKSTVHTKEIFRVAKNLPVVKKLNNGNFDQISLRECEQLFELLDVNKEGELDLVEMSAFLRELLDVQWTEDELLAVYEISDANGSGKITVDEFQFTLSHINGAVRQMLVKLHKDTASQNVEKRKQMIASRMTRKLLRDTLDYWVERDDAFGSLPFTVCYLLVFLLLVISHLKTDTRQELERGLEHYFESYGSELTGPFLEEYVVDANTFWYWMDKSGAPACFGLPSHPNDLLQVASSSFVIGDVQLKKLLSNGASDSVWLLHSSPAVKSIQSYEGNWTNKQARFLEAARATLSDLMEAQWLDYDVRMVKVILCSYSEKKHMFGVTEIQVSFPPTGFVRPRVACVAIPFAVYSDNPFLYVVDGMFLVFVMYQLLGETRGIIKDFQLIGMKALRENFDIWNLIDWSTITLGTSQMVFWGYCVLCLNHRALVDLIDLDTYKLYPRLMDITEPWLSEVYAQLDLISNLFIVLHLLLSINVVSIMMKFFKGFQSNARLQVVTKTLYCAGNELFHWMIVFSTIFLAFAMVGHIAFGQDILQFQTIDQSLNVCFAALLGEFEWYTNLVDDTWPLMPSGMPKLLIVIWFVAFMLLCFLVMFNMLLAIIMDQYEQVASEVKSKGDLAPPIWKQSKSYFLRWRQTRGFIGLRSLLLLLDDETMQVHPEKVVTKDSLCRAFTAMTAEQANWLISWMEKEATSLLEDEERKAASAQSQRIEHSLSNLTEELHLVSLTVNSSAAVLRERQSLELAQEDYNGSPRMRNSSHAPSPREFTKVVKTVEESKKSIEELSRAMKVLVQTVSDLKAEHRNAYREPPEPVTASTKLPHPGVFSMESRWCAVEPRSTAPHVANGY